MKFEWAPVGGADEYELTLTSEDGKTQITEKLKETSFSTDLPVASNYTWKVSASNKDGIVSDATAVAEFSILGKAIENPKIEKPENEFVREIKWSRPDHTSTYDVYVFKYDDSSKKWENIKFLKIRRMKL